jgi:thiamine biosynthesis lipoprotein
MAAGSSDAQSPSPIHQQRYAMGTMFDIVAYHAPREEGERAVARALDEVVRLDQVLSDFEPETDLSRLVREGRGKAVTVDRSLYEVIEQSLTFSRHSGGKFDVTIAPLLKVWKQARNEGRDPSAAEIAAAQRCVGYEKIELTPPDRIQLKSDCVEIDLGAIGKGYAVDRAIAVLKTAGIRSALVNGGSSSIASIGSPPEREGWPVRLNAPVAGRQTLLLRDTSLSTSEKSPSSDIIDPALGGPQASRLTVTVVAPSGTVSDALSTTLLLIPVAEGKKVLEHFPEVSALWMANRELKAAHGESRLRLSSER